MKDSRGSVTLGFQILFLVFAAAMLHAVLATHFLQPLPIDPQLRDSWSRLALLALGGLILAAVPALRRRCSELLAPRIPRARIREVPIVVALNFATALAVLGATALWMWMLGGEPALARHMGSQVPPGAAMDAALSTAAIVLFILTGGLIGPIVEELVFRGLLYSAWKAAWGWWGSAIATSIAFQLFHHWGIAQFLAGLLFVAVMRRTGTLRAAIYAHSLFNMSMWYPLAGRFLTPPGASTGEIHLWAFHLACLAVVAFALPWYLWSARDAPVNANG